MFDAFKILGLAFSGRFKNNEELRKGFWIWFIAQIFSIAALSYSSTLSYGFYLQLIDQAPAAPTIAAAVTILVAVMAYLLINYVCFRAVFIWNGGKMDSHAMSGLVLGFLLAAGVVWWDVQANLTGVAPIAEQTTAAVMQKDTDGISSRYQGLIDQERQAIAQIHRSYTYPDGSVHFQPKPVTNNSRSKWQADAEKVARHEANISRYQELMQTETSQELSAYSRDLQRHESQLVDKTGIHTGIVKWVYGLVLIVSLWSSNYANLALDYVNANPLGDIPGDQTDKFGPATGAQPRAGQNPGGMAEPMSGTESMTAKEMAALQAQLAAIVARLDQAEDREEDDTDHRSPIGFQSRTKPAEMPRPDGAVMPDLSDEESGLHGHRAYQKIRTVTNTRDGHKITCKHCGKTAIMQSSRAKYCSESCRKAAYNQRNPGNPLRV